MSNMSNTMKSTDQQHQGTYQDTERSPNLSINRLPDEVLLEIFDSYRQSINPYYHRWRERYVWRNIAHVCRRWRAVMFASSSRLDLVITVKPRKPGHIKTILSSPLPIFVEYKPWFKDTTGSSLWRMRAALRHRDRVREISFKERDVSFGKFIRATDYHFPALESLDLDLENKHKLDIPATFLRGPDQSDLRLRRLGLYHASLASVSGLLLAATALTDLTLDVFPVGFDSSQGSLLFAFLQHMQSLRSLDLIAPDYFRGTNSQHSTPKDIVPLLKLTHFHYSGCTIFLNNFMSGLSAPSLQDARFVLHTAGIPLLYLPRVFDNVKEEFRSVCVFLDQDFHFLSSTHSGEIDIFKTSFRFNVNCAPDSITSINTTPSTKFAMAEELALFLFFPPSSNITRWGQFFPLRAFLRQFRSVKVLRVDSLDSKNVALYLQQHDGEALLPLLEEVELSPRPRSPLASYSDEECRCRAAEALTAFEQFASARERAGRPVKVYQKNPKWEM